MNLTSPQASGNAASTRSNRPFSSGEINSSGAQSSDRTCGESILSDAPVPAEASSVTITGATTVRKTGEAREGIYCATSRRSNPKAKSDSRGGA
jgi:hypothetical protein